jgi:DNA primase
VARIKEDDIENLRQRADVVDVISSYTNLKKSGGHSFKGLCPFHSEKTPSFTVDTGKGVYFCHGCGEGGNLYHFIEKMESLSFPEAVEWLARREGYELRYEEMRPGEQAARGLKQRLLEANKEAAEFFHRTLLTSPDAADARRYLHGRGFGKEVAERWQLGYAPGRDSLCKHLLAKGFSKGEITKADLGRVSERDGALYDTFRQRIIFPTWSLQKDVVGFGARIVSGDGPKYLNSAETPVFSKSRVMYGLDRAKSAIARGVALVVEGYTDVIALHEAGIQEAVATNGVALGESHFELLKKFSSRAVLMFDADDAGKGATERGFGIHHRIGLEVLVAPLPAGRDPADVVDEDGAEGIRKVVDAGQPLLHFKLEQTIVRLPLDTPEARSAALREAVKVLMLHPDQVARHEYAFMAADMIGVDPVVVQRALGEQRPEASGSNGGSAVVADRRLPGHVKVEREALALLLVHPVETKGWAGRIDGDDFTSSTRRELYTAACSKERPEDLGGLAQAVSPDARVLLSELTVGVAADAVAGDELQERIGEVFGRLHLFRLERLIRSIGNTLQGVNPVAEPERHDQLFTELVGLQAERRDLRTQMQGDN